MKTVFLYYALSLVLVAVTVAGLMMFVTPEYLPNIWREGSVIEMATAYLFGIATLVGLYNAHLSRARGWVVASCLMAFAVMREMDWHKAMTSDSVFKSRFYSGDAPLSEKLLGAAIVFLFLYLTVFFVKKIPHWVRLLRQQDGASWCVFCILGTAAVAKALDSLSRLVPPLKPFYEAHRPVFVLTEETLELLSSAMVCALFIYGMRAIKRGAPLFLSR